LSLPIFIIESNEYFKIMVNLSKKYFSSDFFTYDPFLIRSITSSNVPGRINVQGFLRIIMDGRALPDEIYGNDPNVNLKIFIRIINLSSFSSLKFISSVET